MQGARMIDWTRVTELRDEIGGEDFAEVVAMFLEEADDVVQKLPTLTEAKSIESALHFLKGAALNLGFAELAQLCQGAERQASLGQASIALDTVETCYVASKAAFEAGLDRLGGNRAA